MPLISPFMRRRAPSPLPWESCGSPASISWREQTKAAHEEYLAFARRNSSADVDLAAIMLWLRDHVGPESFAMARAITRLDDRYYRFRRFATHIAPTSASMGYGVPAAVAMQRLYPVLNGPIAERRRRFPT